MLTEQQLLERKKSVGGSDVAAILGISPWKTALDVYLDKTSALKIEDNKDSLRLYNGNYLESWVAHLFTRETGFEVELRPATVRNSKYPYSHVNLDGIVKNDDKNAVLELKITDQSAIFADGIPLIYMPQVMHTRLLTECDRVYLAAAIGFNQFKYFVYEPTTEDIKKEQKLQQVIKIFWEEHVLANNPPPLRHYEQALKSHPESQKNTIKVANTPDVIEAHTVLKQIKETIKECEAKEKELQAFLGSFLEDQEELVDEFNKRMLTWKTQDRSSFDSAAFKKEHPALYEKYVKKSSMRVMRIY